MPAVAREWWTRALQGTDPKQLLWGQVHMGLLNMSLAAKDTRSAVGHCNSILGMNPDQVEWANWKAWPAGTPQADKMLREEKARLRESVDRIQCLAVDKLVGILSREDRPAAVDALRALAAKGAGTPVGKRASELLVQLQGAAKPVGLPVPATQAGG